jgi:sortase A
MIRTLLLLVGLGCVGYCGYVFGMERLNQSYDNWVFEQHIAGNQKADLAAFLKEKTPLGVLVKNDAEAPAPNKTPPSTQQKELAPGDLLGRVEIDRLKLSSMVREGVDAQTLKNSVGHVPSTALPGHLGNFAIAAHRDTLFRALKDIRQDDVIKFQSENQTYIYKVQSTRIVNPTDIAVLRPGAHESLTLITCYPFYFVGSAPKRFIVRADLVSQGQIAKRSAAVNSD